MRYKTLVLQKMDNVDGLMKRLDIALSKGDGNKVKESMEQLFDRLNELRNMMDNEPDEFEKQF